ncbi:MAG: deoxyribodipyrimidine photo-lyase, partial [Acidobacteriota bacterium]|nr:deoxyribodipyrimidine photo-lyase [Acidobacteriota bacterium]
MTALLWLRRELRLHDHPAMQSALEAGGPVVPVFCFDRALLAGPHRSGPRTRFLLGSLADLEDSLRRRASRLVLRDGPAEMELAALARDAGAEAVYATAEVGPYGRRREARVREALARKGVELRLEPGLHVVDDPASIRTAAGAPYTVFSPYHRRWLAAPRREPLPAPSALPEVPEAVAGIELPALTGLGLHDELAEPARGGERRARALMDRFLAEGGPESYERERNSLAATGTSRLSPYLHFGCLSARELEARVERVPGAEAFTRQLCWRDFYAQVIEAFPANARLEHQERYRGRIPWRHDTGLFAAWCEGRTGYPLVDAAMRQLAREGWMHNRARLVAGSFLTKDLGIDWRWGERWFMRLLLDGDEAANNGNWQWIASVGVDPEPAARRIFNPARQQARFDPAGEYVRRHVPELAGVPDRHLGEPWKMPPSVQAQAGCVIGRDYPAPIVDHAHARREAIERYRRAGAG